MERTIDAQSTHFLTIDLDVRSRRSLGDLVAAWPEAYQPLVSERPRTCRWLILNTHAHVATAEQAARRLLRRIGALRGRARRCWLDAHRRTFDIGVQASATGTAFEGVRLTTDTLKRIAAVGGQVQVTVYPPASRGGP